MTYINPSVTEIREWAYSGAPWPVDEWDLFLTRTCEVDLFIELATDPACAHKSFFLHMLYYIVGTTFSVPRKNEAMSRIAWYVDKGRNVVHEDIQHWVGNVDSLLKGRMKYHYGDWRGGKLAGYRFTRVL